MFGQANAVTVQLYASGQPLHNDSVFVEGW